MRTLYAGLYMPTGRMLSSVDAADASMAANTAVNAVTGQGQNMTLTQLFLISVSAGLTVWTITQIVNHLRGK